MPEMPTNQDMDELLEAFLDGDLSPMEMRRVARQVERDPDLARRLEAARRVREGLRSLPRRACPERVAQQAVAYAADHATNPWRQLLQRLSEMLTPPRLVQAGGALAAALVLLLATGIGYDSLSPDAPTTASPKAPLVVESAGTSPSPQEVAAAERDVKLALAYLGKLGRTASGSVRSSLKSDSGNGRTVAE